MILTATTGIIGEGISIQSKIKNEDINEQFEALIKQHAKKKNFEVTGRYSRDDSLIMCISEKMRKGGVLLRHHYNNKWTIPYKVEIIGVDMIDVSKYDRSKNIINGLRKDKYGMITGYFIFKDETKMKSEEIPAEEISSYTDYWMDVSQYTAVSRLCQMLPELDSMLEYQRNELEAASDRSQGSVFWHTKMYDTVLDALRELYTSKKQSRSFPADAKKQAEYFAELTDIQRTVMKQLAGEGIVPAGGVRAIPQEDTVTQIDSKTSSTFEPFTENSSNKLTASQNRSRVITYKNMKNTNWATINALSSIDEKQNATEMRMIKEHILEDYLERLFEIGIQTNKINISLQEYYENPEKYLQWEVLRQSRVVTDESKMATSTKINLETKATTLEEAYKKRGKDYKEEMLKQAQVDIELKKEIEKMYKEAGLENPNQKEGDKEDER
jgi:hypothetical protein